MFSFVLWSVNIR